MKLQTYNQKKTRPEIPIILNLREVSGGVEVVVVDDKGMVLNTLLRFTTDGTVTMAASVNTGFGFKQQANGSIRVTGSNM